jgi:transcriptional regulator
MYVPSHFEEARVPELHAAIRRIALGTLVSVGVDGLIASHVPMLIEPAPAPFGTLIGHVARANPHWRVAPGAEALAMFLGPNAYVTPSWYQTKRETGKVVPTWNYLAVHAYGPLTFFDDPVRLLGVVTRLTESQEGRRAAPWSVSDAPPDFVQGMLRAIVGFELPIARLEGKWKMNQNRSAADRAGTVEGLKREGGPAEATVADVMAELVR